VGLLSLLSACAAARHEPAVRGLPLDDSENATFSAVWIGHATVLMRFGAHRILIDPNLSGAILVYPRLTPPSVQPYDLPVVDLCLISHMHVDHFDLRTVRALGRHPIVVYPQGGTPYMGSVSQRKRMLKAWESITLRGIKITAVPVAHAGGRFALDSLWNHAYTGYVIEGEGRTVFFAGDTGWDEKKFKAIREHFPRIDVAFIPIAPARGGNKNHADPKEALQIFETVGAKYMVPIHFEAYFSSLVPYGEPRKLLEEEVNKQNLGDRVFALHTGERLIVPDEGEKPWVSNQLPPGKPEPPKVEPPPAEPAKRAGNSAGAQKTERPATAE